jgi:integrase
MKMWTAGELRAFLEHSAEDRLYPAFLLACTTGARRGEIAGLRWRDVDLPGARLAVTQTLIALGNKPAFSTPKTARSRRQIALDSGTVGALREHRVRQVEERLAWGPAYQDNDLVFCREDGAPLNPAVLSERFERLAREVDLPRLRFHDLRHTFASLALQAGIHPKVVSERLGHASVAITLDTYSHAIPTMQEEAAEKVAALVFGG